MLQIINRLKIFSRGIHTTRPINQPFNKKIIKTRILWPNKECIKSFVKKGIICLIVARILTPKQNYEWHYENRDDIDD